MVKLGERDAQDSSSMYILWMPRSATLERPILSVLTGFLQVVGCRVLS